MVDKEKFHIFNYIKKEEYSGSMQGMRYMLIKKATEEGDRLEVIIWPEPFCFTKTKEDVKQRSYFEFTKEGVMEAADWLNEQYMEQKQLWDLAVKN